MKKSTSRRFSTLIWFFFLFGLFFTACPSADPTSSGKESDFLRFIESGSYQGRLEAAVITFENEAGASVDLVTALHLADASFFTELQNRFNTYESVLYELIAPEGTRPDQKKPGWNIVTNLQRNLCKVLELEYQLTAIDYHRPNFVHADLTPDRFVELWEEKGESLFTFLYKLMESQLKTQAGMNIDLWEEFMNALKSPERAVRFKSLLARQFENIEQALAGLGEEGEGLGSVLIEERNKAALEKLDQELAQGKRKLAIFFGAGHMPDLERRLIQEMGFKKRGEEWLLAWRIGPIGE